VNILIIGLGSVARKHSTAIRELIAHAEIYALRSSANASVYEEVKNIYSLTEMTVKPDFVIISNPTKFHEVTILQVLQLGCPLFADIIIAEVKKKQVINYVACNMRFHPAIQFLKQYLQENDTRINEVNIYCGSYLPDWRPGKDFKTSYSANADMGGGVHLDLIHELDYCTWLFGMPNNVNAVTRKVSSLQIDAIDSALFQFIYPDFTASISLNYYRKDAKREIEILTEIDTVLVDLLHNTVSSKLSGKNLYEGPFVIADTYTQQMRYFVNHINQHKQPMNSIEEGIAVLKLALHE
jgi:predicted dehydrogenase